MAAAPSAQDSAGIAAAVNTLSGVHKRILLVRCAAQHLSDHLTTERLVQLGELRQVDLTAAGRSTKSLRPFIVATHLADRRLADVIL